MSTESTGTPRLRNPTQNRAASTNTSSSTFAIGPSGPARSPWYLSLYMPVKVLALGLEEGAAVERAAPFAIANPVVFYGTSITQGGCEAAPA